jgi:hypothetical protein
VEAALREDQGVRTRILFIDSSRACSSVDEIDSKEVKVLTRDLICGTLRDGLGVSVCLISHTAKNGTSPRGSGEWAGAADSVLEFQPKDERGDIVRIVGMGRHPSFETNFEVLFDEDEGIPSGVGSGGRVAEAAARKEKGAFSEELLAAAEAFVRTTSAGGVSVRQICDHLSGAGFKISRSRRGPAFVERLLEHAPGLAKDYVGVGKKRFERISSDKKHNKKHGPEQKSKNASRRT